MTTTITVDGQEYGFQLHAYPHDDRSFREHEWGELPDDMPYEDCTPEQM